MKGHQTHRQSFLRIDLMEVIAIVVGYGLAAVLFRAFWPSTNLDRAIGFFAAGFYLWLGMAMSGPLLLIRRGGTENPRQTPPGAARTTNQDPRSWAELAWLMIGAYWIVLGVFVLPGRLHRFRFSDTFLFGAIPLGAAVILRFIGPPPRPEGSEGIGPHWTHHAAVALIATWPIAWICLIVVGHSAF